MNHRRIVSRLTILMLVSSLMLVLSGIASAQDQPTNTITLSEANINQLLRSNNQNPNNDLSVDLQSGQFVVRLVTTGPQGNTTTFALTIVPAVVNQQLSLQATHLTLNDLEIPLNNNPAINSTTDSVNDLLSQQTGAGQIQSVTVTDDRLVLTWLNNDPNAPTVSIRDNLLSVTFTEDSINQMDWVSNPTGQYVSDINVDLLPEHAIISVSRTIDPTLVTYEIRPIQVNGYVAWQVHTQANLETSLASTMQAIWHAYFGGILGEGSMIDAVVTDNTVQFTWDLSNQVQETTPVVTYTITEAEVNEALKAFTNEQMSNLFVDMKADSLTITASGLGDSGTPYAITVVIVPTLSNGQLTWEVTGVTFNSLTIDPSQLESTNQLTDPVTHGLGGNQRSNAYITNFTMTEHDMTMTVNYP